MSPSGRKGKGGHIKSLHIKLPVDHPVFSFPEGERSRVAREWLEQGRQVTKAMQELKQELQEIKEILKKGGKIEKPNQVLEQRHDTECQNATIDPAVFLKI
ncbi:MAG: hypothetical protein FH756_00470 [Firmicutes bacterium]|nr:hypothetical protein [Bacillota bacterium]